LNINEDLAYRKIISCTNVIKIKSIGVYLKLNVNGRTKLGGTQPPPPEGSWKPKYKTRNWTESRNSKGAVVMVVALPIATDLT
jgi:hypothetical protein